MVGAESFYSVLQKLVDGTCCWHSLQIFIKFFIFISSPLQLRCPDEVQGVLNTHLQLHRDLLKNSLAKIRHNIIWILTQSGRWIAEIKIILANCWTIKISAMAFQCYLCEKLAFKMLLYFLLNIFEFGANLLKISIIIITIIIICK